jgi:hypothetical protein
VVYRSTAVHSQKISHSQTMGMFADNIIIYLSFGSEVETIVASSVMMIIIPVLRGKTALLLKWTVSLTVIDVPG